MNKLYQLINCRKNRTEDCDKILNDDCPGTCEYYKFMSGYYVTREVGFNLELIVRKLNNGTKS